MKNLVIKSKNKMLLLIAVLFYVYPFINAQTFEVSYTPLASDLFTGNKPIKIGVIENISAGEKLYEGLIQSNIISSNFEVYPSNVLNANKEILGGELNPENKKFLQSLNEILGLDYLLEWKSIDDSLKIFQLTVFSTKSFNKIYDNKFYPSQNSNPILDVNILLSENKEPIYSIIFGELEIKSKPDSADFKLYRDSELIKEWSGNEKQKIESGKYRLITEAYGYKNDERDIEVSGEGPTLINIKLEQDLSMLPNIFSSDNLISNIESELDGEQLKIFYDLIAEKESEYNIHLLLTDRMTKNSIEINKVFGDTEGVKPGKSRIIIWQFQKEIGNNNLKNYDLKITAKKEGGLAWYVYAGGGALLLGGAAALLISSPESTPAEREKINTPPARPTGN